MRSPMIHRLWMTVFPCGAMVERRSHGGGRNRALWLIPAAALGRPPEFSTRFCPCMSLILASTSPIRLRLLTEAGVEVRVVAPRVDEDVVKQDHDGDAPSLALRLAEAKALSLDSPGDLVIGSDSTLAVDGRLFSKPADRAEAARHLAHFSGKRDDPVERGRAGARRGDRVEPRRKRDARGARACRRSSSKPISTPNGPRSLIASACSAWRGAA